MRMIACCLSLTVLAALSGAAQAGPIVDNAAKAEQLLQQGDPIGAANALDDAMEELWLQSPLTFRKVLFVEDSEGYGVYRPREGNVFKPGESMVIYVEPLGFAYGKHSLGGYEVGLTTDFVLTDTKGKTLFARENFLTFKLPLRYHNREFQMQLTVSLTGIPPGKYIGKYHVHDDHSPKTADFELPFEVAQ